jgi:hypothetical protein
MMTTTYKFIIFWYVLVNKQVNTTQIIYIFWGSLWPWSHGSWIYNYLLNQCLSILMLWVRIFIRERCATMSHQAWHWLATGRWLSTSTPVSYTNNTVCHDITEILFKVALKTIKQTNSTFPSIFVVSLYPRSYCI